MAQNLVEQASPVDVDKLWRVRVAKELHSEKSWRDNYGYMVDSAKQLSDAMDELKTHPSPESDKKKVNTRKFMESAAMSGTEVGSPKSCVTQPKNKPPSTIDPYARSFDSKVMGQSAFARKTTKWE